MAIEILVAEDHDPLREHLVQYLAAFGIQSIQAENVHEALVWVELHMVDAVVIDLLLCGKLSVPVIRRASALGMPVLVYSAFERKAVDKAIGPLDTDCYYAEKPQQLSALRDNIIYMTGRREAVNEGRDLLSTDFDSVTRRPDASRRSIQPFDRPIRLRATTQERSPTVQGRTIL